MCSRWNRLGGILGACLLALAPGPRAWASQEPPAATPPQPPANPSASRTVVGPVLPDDRLGIRTAPLLLLSRGDVRADLQLNEQQAASAVKMIAELHARALALRARPMNDPAVAQGRKAVDDAQVHWIGTNLSTAQRDRLLQIDLQWEGPTAVVSRPLVAETLELTPEQRATIGTAVKEHLTARASGKATRADVRTLTQTVLNTLTPAQRERWKAMLGREFVLQSAAANPPSTPQPSVR
ncbi:MAG: hypothetical protein U0794_04530 [Isosphaeraceae bacterium]